MEVLHLSVVYSFFVFLFLSSAPLYGYPEIYLYTHLFGGHWSSFHFGVTMDKAAVI